MTDRMDRRAFLHRSGVAGVGLAAMGVGLPTLLGACGSSGTTKSAPSGPPGAGSLGAITTQLNWIKDAEFSGEYIADTKGYHTSAGLKGVTLLSGGPSVPQDSVVAAGKVGISSPDTTGPATLKGAPLVIVAAQYQKNPFAIMSLVDSPLKTPQDKIGKKVGVQSVNLAIWESFLKADGIDSSKVTVFPAQFDPTPLAQKQCDGWFSFITNAPILLAGQGVQTSTFLLNDFHYPLVSESYIVNKAALSDSGQRAQLKENLATLSLAGTKVDKSLFDTSLIDEIYTENPSLKASPV